MRDGPLTAGRWLAAFAAAIALLSAATPAGATGSCDRYAATTGSDATGDGSIRAPFQTLRHLDAELRPGQTGCLRGGTYGDISTWHEIATNGTPGHQVTITATPGQHVKVIGWVDIEASYTTVSGLEIDGTNTFYEHNRPTIPCPSHGISDGLEIDGTHDVFEHNDYYESNPGLRGIGLSIGFARPADDLVVRYNRIHDVGQCMDYDHLIYLAAGRDVQVYDNWIWNDTHGWGVQVYPRAVGAHIFSNVIDHAGAGFVVGGTSETSGNRIDHNIVIRSVGLPQANVGGVAVSEYWEGAVGANNSFTTNDAYLDPGGIGRVRTLHAAGNLTRAPDFVDPTSHDYRVLSTSAFASWGLWNGGMPAATAARSAPARHRVQRSRTRRS